MSLNPVLPLPCAISSPLCSLKKKPFYNTKDKQWYVVPIFILYCAFTSEKYIEVQNFMKLY